MPSDVQQQLVSAEAIARRHEAQNPAVCGVLVAAAWIAGITAACAIIVWFSLSALARSRPKDNSAAIRGIIVASNAALLERFPSPHLQLNPPADLAGFRAQEDEVLTNY